LKDDHQAASPQGVAAFLVCARHGRRLLAPTSRRLMVTIPFVLYELFRYLYVIYRAGGGGAP
jgi:hypothetical protein